MSTPVHAFEPPSREPSRRADPPPQEEAFPLFDYLQLLWFRRRLIIAVTVLVAILGYLWVNQIQSLYTARSTLMIGVSNPIPLSVNQGVYDRNFGLNAPEEVEVLKSRGLAEKVITEMNLLSNPEFNPSLREPKESIFDVLAWLNPVNWIPDSFRASVRGASTGELVQEGPSEEELERRTMVRAVNIFLGKLGVSPQKYTEVINITFTSPNPRLAMNIANQVPETYITDKLEAKLEATERVTGWLSEQLEELEQNVRDSEQAVEMYRIEHGLTEVGGRDLLTQQLSSINSQLIIAKAERAEAEARLAQVERLLASDEDGLEAARNVLSSPLIDQLRTQEAEIMRRISELAVEYGPKHPRMLQVNAELVDVRERIDAEIEQVLLGLKNEVEVARTREASLEESLREVESQTGDQNREAIQLRALQREASANRALFETFLTRFKETSTTEGTETPDARVLSSAELPTSPSYPDRTRLFGIIVLLGFSGACALVIGVHLLSPGMLSPEQIEQHLGVHVIGMLPKLSSKEGPVQHLRKTQGSSFVEAVNSLQVSLRLSDPDSRFKTIQITSSLPEEGKSSLVVVLGMALARSGKKVIVVDGDLRRSSIHEKLNMPAEGPGLTDIVLAKNDNVEDFILTDEKSGLDYMGHGDGKFLSAADLFSSRRMRRIVELLEERYDHVLIDAPPVMVVSDARVIGQLADKTLFVVQWNKTPKKVARSALDLLEKAHIDIAGIVLQQVDLKRYGRLGYGGSGYYFHYGRYGQYYS